MDPVSVFNALYDTKCIKLGRYELKSGLVAPYYINLRRLPLYPALMNAIVTQVVEKFLSKEAISLTISQIRQKQLRSLSTASRLNSTLELLALNKRRQADEEDKSKQVRKQRSSMRCPPVVGELTDSDSQLGEDDIESSSTSSSCVDEEQDAEYHDSNRHDPIIVGVPYGAIPIAAAVAYQTKLPFLFERKETKQHGDQQPLIEDFTHETRKVSRKQRGGVDDCLDKQSKITTNQQASVILIEDVICSGESILQTVKQLQKQNIKVEFVICIIDREENGVKLLLEQAGVNVLSLYKMSAILRILETTGRLTSEQFLSIRKWICDNQFEKIGVDPTRICVRVDL